MVTHNIKLRKTLNGKNRCFLLQLLSVDWLPLDLALVYPGKVTRVSIELPSRLYQDGEINLDIWRIFVGKYVVCGEISLYEFGGDKGIELTGGFAGGPQSNEIKSNNPFLFQGVFPNPTKADLKVRLNSPDERRVIIKMFDVAGRLVDEIFDNKLKIGVNEITIKAEKYPAGIYFVRIDTGEDIITEKAIMLR